jgi:FkbM family methyltransferase
MSGMDLRNTLAWPVKRLRPTVADDLVGLVRASLRSRVSRQCLNTVYGWLSWDGKSHFHRRFSQAFWTPDPSAVDGVWDIRFLGKRLRIPLAVETLKLDWDVALAVLGHDSEIKQTYATLLTSPSRPDVFIDVGTNFGTHSLLFLNNGVPTLSFEPNPACAAFVRRVSAANDIQPHFETVALSDTSGWTELAFPADEAWLGSTDDGTVGRLGQTHVLQRCPVELKRLDEYLPQLPPGRVLVKIDTEGNECRVLRGATSLMKQRQPLVIFESWPDPAREELAAFFAELDYAVHEMPWDPDRRAAALGRDAFLASAGTNFLAAPCQQA